jgi:exodeoxyribonuclease V beta subunit
VALIDEFQDTDAIQYRIFDAIYRVEANDAATALVLIGDPKQAIYAFRGADIYTYLAARAATAGRLYTLGRNFRSTHAMVRATNRCFQLAEEQEGGRRLPVPQRGGQPGALLPADANGRKDALQAGGQPLAALNIWRLPPPDDGEPMSKGAYLEAMADVCASEMVRLLNLGQRGEAGFAGDDGARAAPGRPGRAGQQPQRGRRHPRRAGEPGRAQRVSVGEGLRLPAPRGLRAAAVAQRLRRARRRPRAARRAGHPDPRPRLGQLDRLNHDEIAWDDYVLQFRAYRDCWRRQGVLPMLRRLLNDFRVPARLLAAGGSGERSLTDLLHLAELLQQASSLLDGEHALIRHLAEQRREDASGGEARQVRLESDADLVQVVTIHKSKGLEYPLVFLPFACAFRATKATDLPLKWHDAHGRLQLALTDDALLALADRERLGEDLRKLYVALTRARYATWIGAAPLNELENSAFGHLIGGTLQAGIDALAAGCRTSPSSTRPPAGRRYRPRAQRDEGRPQPAPRRPRALVDRQLLGAAHRAAGQRAETPAEDVFREAAARPAPPPPARRARARSAAARLSPRRGGRHLPARDPRMGRRPGLRPRRRRPALLRDAVARRCAVRGWERWIDPLCAWLQDFLRLPLARRRAPRRSRGLDTWVAEMEFWVAVHDVDLAALDALVCRHTLGGAERPPLQAGQLNGMLKGFIDLVVEHEGRYYVIDYKSNWLGPDDAAYTPAAMAGRSSPSATSCNTCSTCWPCTACSSCACPITTTTRTSAARSTSSCAAARRPPAASTPSVRRGR